MDFISFVLEIDSLRFHNTLSKKFLYAYSLADEQRVAINFSNRYFFSLIAWRIILKCRNHVFLGYLLVYLLLGSLLIVVVIRRPK